MAVYSSMKTRIVWLTEADWRAFADLLAETFPTIRYYESLTREQRQAKERPAVPRFRQLFDVPGILRRGHIVGVFDENWQPDVQWLPDEVEPGRGSWGIANHADKNPAFLFQMFQPIYTAEKLKTAPFMEHCVITFYRDPGNHEHDLLSRHFYRLLGKVCTNRNQIQISMPERKPMFDQPKGSLFWLGRDALHWVREDSQRVFFYNDRKWAIRPAEN